MLKPLKTRVLLKKQTKTETTNSGIYLGSSVTDAAATYAEVVAIGSAVTECSVGDIVIPDWRAVVPVKYDDVEYLLVEEKGIIGVFE